MLEKLCKEDRFNMVIKVQGGEGSEAIKRISVPVSLPSQDCKDGRLFNEQNFMQRAAKKATGRN